MLITLFVYWICEKHIYAKNNFDHVIIYVQRNLRHFDSLLQFRQKKPVIEDTYIHTHILNYMPVFSLGVWILTLMRSEGCSLYFTKQAK